jgi:hypothetical protein
MFELTETLADMHVATVCKRCAHQADLDGRPVCRRCSGEHGEDDVSCGDKARMWLCEIAVQSIGTAQVEGAEDGVVRCKLFDQKPEPKRRSRGAKAEKAEKAETQEEQA